MLITSNYLCRSTNINIDESTGETIIEPIETYYMFETDRLVPKLGVLLAGIGGNNGTTAFLGCNNKTNEQIYVPLKSLIPMVNPNDITISGWDINNMSSNKAIECPCVLEYDLQNKLVSHSKDIKPMKSIYFPDIVVVTHLKNI